MRLLKKKKEKPVYTATYEKRCPCCGIKYKASYVATDFYSYQSAKDSVNSYYNAHRLFCSCTVNPERIA